MNEQMYSMIPNTKQESQSWYVERWLRDGKGITPLEALHKWGIFRLSAIIFNLRADGMDIETKMIKQGKKKYAEYSYNG
jgi:hypothetical protein